MIGLSFREVVPMGRKYLNFFWDRLNFRRKPLTPRQVLGAAGAVIFFMMVTAVWANETRPWALRLGDRVIAVVADKDEARAVLEEYLAEWVAASGKPVSVAGRIAFERAKKTDGPAVGKDELRRIIAREVSVTAPATAVLVNGKSVLYVPDQETANRLLTALKERYAAGGQARFAEDVTLQQTDAPVGQILTLDEALQAVQKGTREVQKYTVREGDTLWAIAAAAKMDLDRLLALNPGLSPDHLQVGQTLNLTEYSPLLNVLATRKATVKEEIPYQVEEREDKNLYRGQSRIVQEGEPGEKEVTYEITYRNGLEKSRTPVEEKVVKEPVPQVVARGSRVLLASRGGSGRLAWPVAGSIVSGFGYRGREFHAGIDIAADTGDPVAAAESGRVTRAGWYGGYGKCVDIDHGSGVVTRYAHLSAIEVGVGEWVSRGDLVGYVGSTGNA
ncbi:MAG: peptidoglycan DD-metalloendopeptidase family protein, partial [Desulfotomaculales bacterium]